MDRTIILNFGRMNPPHRGHEKLVTFIEYLAKKFRGDGYVFLSKTQDNKKNPLTFDFKLRLCKQAFSRHRVKFSELPTRTIIDALKWASRRYQNLIFVVGADRLAEMQSLINKYNGVEYKFKSIQVVSAGDRDPDSDGVVGLSASKMRNFVLQNDYKSFKEGLPRGVKDDMSLKAFTEILNSLKKG